MRVVVNCVGEFSHELDLPSNAKITQLQEALAQKNLPRSLDDAVFVFRGQKLHSDLSLSSLSSSPHILVLYKKKPSGTSDQQPTPLATPSTAPQEARDTEAEIQNIVNSFSQQLRAPQAQAAPAPSPATPSPAAPPAEQQEVINSIRESEKLLVEAGFPLDRVRIALVRNGGDPNAALEWLLEHIEDDLSGETPTVPAEIRSCIASNICTYCVTGPVMTLQPWYQCLTCNLANGAGCCQTCAQRCHAGHNLVQRSETSSAYCDCGSSDNCQSKRNA